MQTFSVVIRQATGGSDPHPLPVVRREIHDHCLVKVAIDRTQIHRRHHAGSIDANQRAGRGSGPDIAVERSDAVDLAVLHQRIVNRAVVPKMASSGIHDAQRLAAADPYPVKRVDVQRLDRVAGQRCRVGRIMPPGPESCAVVPHQTIQGAKPQIAGAILVDRNHHGRWESVAGTHDPETRNLRNLRRTGQRAQQQDQQNSKRTHVGILSTSSPHARNGSLRAQAKRGAAGYV